MTGVRRLATLVVTMVLCLAGSGLVRGAAAPPAAAPKKTQDAASKARPMPDSVLARVGQNRTVTTSEFRKAWGQLQPPARQPPHVRRFHRSSRTGGLGR